MVSLNIELSEELFAAMHKDRNEMSRANFIYSLKEFSVSPFQYTAEEILSEVDTYQIGEIV